jgi:hypothetical protein
LTPQPAKPDELRAIVATVAAWAEGHSSIDRVTLFGSRVRGDNREDSDLDLHFGTDFARYTPNDMADWQQQNADGFASLKRLFPYCVHIAERVREFGQTMQIIRAGVALPEFRQGKVRCVYTAKGE